MLKGKIGQSGRDINCEDDSGFYVSVRNAILKEAWIGQGERNWSDRPDMDTILKAAEALG